MIDRQKLLQMAVGLGKGLQSYDPNNPMSGAGAALATTAGLAYESEERKASEEKARRERQQAIADARADRLMQRDEERKYEEERYQRRREESKADRAANREDETAAIMARERELAKIRKDERGEFSLISRGLKSSSASGNRVVQLPVGSKPPDAWSEWLKGVSF